MFKIVNIQIMVASMLALTATGLVAADSTAKSGDAYIRTDDAKWVLGTRSVEKVIESRNGDFLWSAL